MLSHPRKQKANPQVVVVPVTPVVQNDSVTTKRNAAIVINVLTNDVDYNPATVTIVDQPTSGGTAVANPDGTITFTPSTDFVGDTSFSYTVRSPAPHNLLSNAAIVGVHVTAPAVPVIVNQNAYVTYQTTKRIYILLGATDADNDITATTTSLTITNPTHGTAVKGGSGLAGLYVDYTPSNGYSGPDSFTYSIKDAENNTSNVATVTLNVAPAVVAGDKPAWVDAFPHKYTVRFKYKAVTTKDPLVQRVQIGGVPSDGYFIIDTPQPEDVLPPHLVSKVGSRSYSADDQFSTCVMACVASNSGAHVSEWTGLYPNDGVKIIMPAGHYYLGNSTLGSKQIFRAKAQINICGPYVTYPWYAPITEVCQLAWEIQLGFPVNLRDGSTLRFENINFYGPSWSTKTYGVVTNCKYAAKIEFVHCGKRFFSDGFKFHEEQLTVGYGTTGGGKEGRDYDTTTSAFGFRNAGIWMYDTHVHECGINNGASILHNLYGLNGQLRLDSCAFTDSYFSGPGGGVGNHLVKFYGILGCFNSLFSTHTRADIGFEGGNAGNTYQTNVYWGQNMDLNAFSPTIAFGNCQFVYWQRTNTAGVNADPNGNDFIQAGRRNATLCENVAHPWYFFRMTKEEQNQYSYKNRPGQWFKGIGYPPKDVAVREVRYGMGRCAIINKVTPGTSSITLWDMFTRDPATSTPRHATFDIDAWDPQYDPSNGDDPANIVPWGAPYSDPNYWTLCYSVVNTTTGAVSFRSETVTCPDYSHVTFNAGGGPPAGTVIPGGTFVEIYRTDLGPDTRMLNPIYHNPAHPDYYWPKVRALTAPESIVDPIIVHRYLFNSYLHYIGPAGGNGGNNVCTWMSISPQLPSSYGLGPYGEPRLVLPPQWNDNCSWSRPTNSGIFDDKHSHYDQYGFVGGTQPTGYSGYLGSDYTEPSDAYYLNNARTLQAGPYDNGTSWDLTWPQMFPCGYVGDQDAKARFVTGSIPWQSPTYDVPRYRYNNSGQLKKVTDSDPWPDEATTTLAADAAIGATQIVVTSATGIVTGMTIAFFIAADRWGITQTSQRLSDAANIKDKNGNRFLIQQWRHVTKVTGVNGTTITIEDAIPTYAEGPSVGAYAGVAVVAHKTFALPQNAPTTFEMLPHAKFDFTTITE